MALSSSSTTTLVEQSGCKTETEARQEMTDCQRDDLMFKTARGLVEKAVSALMRTHHIGREAAHGWIREAAG
jgi:hypothetical protein